jgi:hypothetical protein
MHTILQNVFQGKNIVLVGVFDCFEKFHDTDNVELGIGAKVKHGTKF